LRVDDLATLPFPVERPMWGVASLKATRPQLRGMLGEPHFVETDPRATCGGEQDAWQYRLPTGQRLLIILDVVSEWAELFGDPPNLGPILVALGIRPDDSRLRVHPEPLSIELL
jgi:hypothetical protein